MAICEVCGNDYDSPIEISGPGGPRIFDSFECAIHALAPTCAHCGIRVLGHGVQEGGRVYCCAHCARAEGATEVRDRA